MDSTLSQRRRLGEDRSLSAYYREIERYPQLTLQQERALTARMERGDEQALEELVKANLRFVIHVAGGFRGQGLSMADLINEGNLGLLTAARKFNRRKGCKFITYAVWWIRQNILKALEVQTRSIRVPSNVLNDLNGLRRTEADLAQSLERSPTPEEIAAEIDFRPEKVAYTLQAASNTASLDTPLYGGDGGSLLESVPDTDVPSPDESFIRKSLRGEVHAALGTLSDRHRQILSLCFGVGEDGPATYQQIGLRLGVSRERVRQLKEDALNKLRHPALTRRLAEYCE